MISYFIKPRHRHDLAECAVIFPLVVGMSILAPLSVYGLWTIWLPLSAPGWVRGLPFWLWMAWAVVQWITLIKLVRAAGPRSSSVEVFHRIQVVCLVFVSAHLLVTTGSFDKTFLTIWATCVEVAMLVFYTNYFLLALGTWTRVSWRALTGFILVAGALVFEVWSANRPVR